MSRRPDYFDPLLTGEDFELASKLVYLILGDSYNEIIELCKSPQIANVINAKCVCYVCGLDCICFSFRRHCSIWLWLLL